jgi:hypothetical protein
MERAHKREGKGLNSSFLPGTDFQGNFPFYKNSLNAFMRTEPLQSNGLLLVLISLLDMIALGIKFPTSELLGTYGNTFKSQ